MNPPRERAFNVPAVVLTLVALLGLTHLSLWYFLSTAQTDRLLALFAFTPLRYADVVPVSIPSWWGPQVWTFVSYAFLHADLNHLIFNLLWLIAFGSAVARRFGTFRFLVLFAVTAAAGALAHLVLHWHGFAPMIGASAAVSGAMGAAMRFAFQQEGPLGLLGSGEDDSYRVPAASLAATLRDRRAFAFLVIWFGVNLLFGLGAVTMPGASGAVAWEAHIGGFLAGLLGFRLFDPVKPSDIVQKRDDTTVVPEDKPLNQ